jgi:hypothetical protein
MKDLRFDLYRYQILPRDRQAGLFDEQVLAKKNELFTGILRGMTDFGNDRIKVIMRRLFDQDSFFLLRFAVNRWLQHETRDFNDELIETWPDFYVSLWNDPQIQLIAVQERKEAFQQTSAILNMMADVINIGLAADGLRISFMPLFIKDDFWKIIEAYKKEIKEIEFQLITPNMANIAGALSEDLKSFARDTNTSRTRIEITADPDAALNIARSDPRIGGLVDYASEGGGTISVKVERLRKRLRTSDSIKTIEISEARISGTTAEEVATLLKDMMT